MDFNEKIVVKQWHDQTEKEIEVVTTLYDVIKEPAGFKMEEIGLMLFNIEREKQNLPIYKKNKAGNYEEV